MRPENDHGRRDQAMCKAKVQASRETFINAEKVDEFFGQQAEKMNEKK